MVFWKRKNKESSNPHFSHVYLINKWFDLSNSLNISSSLAWRINYLLPTSLGWRSNEIMEMSIREKNALPKAKCTPSLRWFFRSCCKHVQNWYIHSKVYLPLLLSKYDRPFQYLSGFQIMYFSRCSFLPLQADLICSFPACFSNLSQWLCTMYTSVCNSTLATLICSYNHHNRFTASSQAIGDNVKWNASEADLCSPLLELAACHFSFLLGFSASFQVISHVSENLLT